MCPVQLYIAPPQLEINQMNIYMKIKWMFNFSAPKTWFGNHLNISVQISFEK